jgi:hypothetical protein
MSMLSYLEYYSRRLLWIASTIIWYKSKKSKHIATIKANQSIKKPHSAAD